MFSRKTTAGVVMALLCCLAWRGAAQFASCNGTLADIGNGRCDAELNQPACGFDAGDCCPCTCLDGPAHSCSDSVFDCLYPDCGESAETPPEESTCDESWKGDGYCDENNNRAGCDWDGGDCCECSCLDGPIYECGHNGWACLDPTCLFDPVVIADYPECTGSWLLIGDGDCNAAENNNEDCGWDSGDCCLCSCSGERCSVTSFACLDPGAGNEFFECGAPPAATLPCSAEAQQTWVVETSAQAQALAEAVRCSGGSFEVEWRGNVVVNEPLFIADGTVLVVTGAGSAAVIDGNAATRLFTVTNAVLHLNNVDVSFGASVVGGAVAAAGGSSLAFNRTNFVGNRAAGNGGAVYVSDGSDASCAEVSFLDNRAGIDGGAMFVTGSSVVSCGAAWVNNTAGDAGGALSVFDDSTFSWGEQAIFVFNAAERFGGAMDVGGGSSVSWSAPTSFENNVAGGSGGAVLVLDSSLRWNSSTVFGSNSALRWNGGALVVAEGSHVSWSGVSTYPDNTASTEFLENTAGTSGGAAYATRDSTLSWDGGIDTVFDRNQAGWFGGAIAASSNSSVSSGEGPTSTFSENSAGYEGGAISLDAGAAAAFGGSTLFDRNTALGDAQLTDEGGHGGAVAVRNSTATWNGSTSFTGNVAMDGGAVFAHSASEVRGGGETKVSNNSAAHSGGGVFLGFSSSVSWAGDTEIASNTAGSTGGAISVSFSSSVSWAGNANISSNSATAGGALSVAYFSGASWSGRTTFSGNSASTGGALFLGASNVTWSGETCFVANSAGSGGAIKMLNGSLVEWTADSEFSSNAATADGGAVGSFALDSVENLVDSTLAVNGRTTFSNNTSGANGGVLALLGGLSLHIGAVEVSFVDNTAAVAGGAVFVSGTGVGPIFASVSFVSNSAQVGGAISTVGSGTLKESASVVPPYPTTFERCWFVDNTATATGGAVESAAGQDSFIGSVFEGNKAREGGALRLAGTTSMENCTFVENVSGDGGGAAVSNIGSILKMENVSFAGNAFACQPGMFLDYNASGDPYETACSGCLNSCDGCAFEEPPLVPMCTAAMEHAFCAGGTDTKEMLSIERGYWRATPSSDEVFACYNADACLGGVTGAPGYCLEGYEGPYCSICSSGYTAELSFTCRKCSDSAGGIVLAAVLAVVALVVAATVAAYATSGKVGAGRGWMVEQLGRYIPFQSIKIVIVAWQILTQFTSVANVSYPAVYQRFLDGLEVFNFDLGWVLSAGCVFDVDFHDRLLVATICPIVALLFLWATYAVAARVNRGASETMRIVWDKHVSMVLLLTFLVYASVSSVLFMAFACEELEDGKNYLRADYRIECDSSKHEAFQVYAGVMIMLYTVGIPFFYGILLFRDREVLRDDQADRDESARISSTSDLWSPYKPSVFYYEVIECGRRVLLAGVVVFIYPNTAAQVAVTLLIAFVFVVVSEALAPYASRWDTWLNRMGHAVVFVSMYVALLLKVDVSDERADSQKVFEAVLVAVHACMILVVVIESVVQAYAVRVEQRGENESAPWFPRRKSWFGGSSTITLAQTDPSLSVVCEEEVRSPGD